jgi:hypothetical protein
MKYGMTEFEYIIEFLDDNGVARDADTEFFATHEEAELLAEKVFGKMKVRYAWVHAYRIVSIPLPHL